MYLHGNLNTYMYTCTYMHSTVQYILYMYIHTQLDLSDLNCWTVILTTEIFFFTNTHI